METSDEMKVRPLPPRPTTEYVELVGRRCIADLDAMADVFKALGRPRAHVDRLRDARAVIAEMVQ